MTFPTIRAVAPIAFGLAAACSSPVPAQTLPDGITGKPSWSDEMNGPPKADRGYSPWPGAIASRILPTGEEQVYTDPSIGGPETISPRDGTWRFEAKRLDPGAKAAIQGRMAAEKPAPPLAGALARAGWASGVVKWPKPQGSGYWEARLQLDNAPSGWPAFWLWPAQWGGPGEIDVMEAPGDGLVHQTVHGNGGYKFTCSKPWQPGWHTYGVLTEASGQLTFFIDGEKTCSTKLPENIGGKNWYPALNLAVGGWAKKTTPDTTPPVMVADYVRYWKK